ncbi:DNA-processing protein DprA [Roseateles sp.]|uniref:DNA-processing protein DprA n=1 Tax=Roseateles sp. TaxID=1971397 RepID=UPI003BA6F127
MTPDELAAWLRLLETPGIGLESARRLLSHFGSPQAVWESGAGSWQELLSPKQCAALRQAPPGFDAQLEATQAWLAADTRHQVLVLGDADYPQALLETADPPLLLYLDGRRELLGQAHLAVVGSRSPSAQGRDNARNFSQALSEAGLCVVSGLALGVDGAAHMGALQGSSSTIAVVGTGLDQIYPSRHLKLGQQIAEEGLLISEYALGTPPLAPNFPRRNRIIAGLSMGCLVVEAALQSGSLITARLASEAGREVFAIPGSIHSPLSHGCHALIRQGAKLVENIQDVLDELPQLCANGRAQPTASAQTSGSSRPAEQTHLLTLMGFDPISLDSLQQRGGWPVAELNALLLELELDGAVARLAGQLFQRRGAA